MADSASVSDPPYVDVFTEGKLDDTTKKTLINAKWDTVHKFNFPSRYFNRRSGKVQEDFLGFAMCTSTTGEALSEAFLDNLRKAGVNIQAMRGQGYDGAANMSGRNRGVQARIRQVVPKAIYTHCKAHSLNLAIVHASKEPHARNMMGTVQEIAFLFDYSAKRLLVFQEHLNDNNQDRAEMERRTKLRTLCETRWAARADALYTFKASFGTVVQSLETLSFTNDAKAAAYKAAITQFSFIVTLVAIEHVLSACVPLSKQLQASNTDLLAAKTEADVVIAQVAAERNDPLVWQALYDKAVEMARSVDVEPAIRRGGRQQNRPNAPADTVPDYWRINMYLPFIDHLIGELQERVLGGNERYCIQYLLPQNIRNLNDQHAIEIYQAVGDDMIDNQEAFIRECQRWKTRCEGVQFDPSTERMSGAEGCSFATLNIPVVPFCKNHIRNGQAIVVASNDVPHNQEVTCKCDVKVAGTDELLVRYESPDYTNCGVQLQIDNMLYSCQDSVTSLNVTNRQQFQMLYKKTTSTANPNMCIMFRSVSNSASSIKVTCEENDDIPVTLKQTTTRKPVYTTSSTQIPYTHYTDRQNISTLTSSDTTNITQFSLSISSFSSTNITTPAAATVPTTQSSFSSSTSSTLSTTAQRFDLHTSQLTSNQSESITYFTTSTDMPIQWPNHTTVEHLTSEDTQERSSPPETSRITQKQKTRSFSSTNITTHIAATVPTTQSTFSSSTSSTLSTTAHKSDIHTSQATSNQSESITYFTSSTDMPIQRSNHTTVEQITSENTKQRSSPSEISRITQTKQTSSFSSTNVTKPIAATVPKTQSPFPSSASSTLSTTAQKSDIHTSQATSNQSKSITYLTSSTDMPILGSNLTTFKHLTPANTQERSSPPEISQTTQKNQTSTTLQSSNTALSLPADGSDSTSDVSISLAADFITTTPISLGQSKEDTKFKTVIIICSVLGCVLLMVVAVALAILIYKNRNTKKNNTFNSNIHQQYIDAFDPERRESKSDGVFLHRVLLTDHVNDPLKTLYSIPHKVNSNTDIKTKRNSHTEIDGDSSVPRTHIMEEGSFPLKFEADNNEMKASLSQRSLVSPVMDTSYDHIDARREKASDEVLQDLEVKYDHFNRFQEKHFKENVWQSTDRVQSDGSRDALPAKSTVPFGGGENHYQTETIVNEIQSNNDIYTIVRKPREMYTQKKVPKLVTFKGCDDVMGETHNGSKEILQNKSTEMHDGDYQRIYDKHSLYRNTKIPRVKLNRDYLYSTVSKVNRSDEEKAYHDQQVVGHM